MFFFLMLIWEEKSLNTMRALTTTQGVETSIKFILTSKSTLNIYCKHRIQNQLVSLYDRFLLIFETQSR